MAARATRRDGERDGRGVTGGAAVFAAHVVLVLWAVAGLAVAGGNTLLRFVDIATIRKITATMLVSLAAWTPPADGISLPAR